MLPGGERGAGRLEIRGLGCRVSGLYRVVKSLGFKASGAGCGVRGFRVIQGLVTFRFTVFWWLGLRV